MNNQTAQAGFKTFLITLSVSLALFGVLYFILASGTSKPTDIESETSSNKLADTIVTTAASDTADSTVTQAPSAEPTRVSVFADLSKGNPGSAVLGAADESTQGTKSINTGSTEITIALLASLGALGFGGLVYIRGPRKAALARFERDLTREL